MMTKKEKRRVPELRFDGFEGEWEKRTIENILTIGSGKDYKHLQEGDIPVYGTGGLMTKVNDYLYDGESIGIGRKGTIDKPQFVEVPFWAVDTTYYTIINEDLVLPYYFFLLINTIDFNKYKYGSAVPSMTQEVLKEILFAIPSLLEQEVIVHHIESECSRIDFKKARTEELIELLTEYRTALVSEAVTGKINVTED